MRGKNFNTGLRGVLFDAKHHKQMGQAIWLYGWLMLRQTRQEGTIGLVLGGHAVSYREIEEETGFPRKTLERWMSALRRAGYVVTQAAPSGVIVQITKAKKWAQPTEQIAIPFVEPSQSARQSGSTPRAVFHRQRTDTHSPGVCTPENSFPARREPRPVPLGLEEAGRKFADGSPQNCVSDGTYVSASAADAERISSGFIAGENSEIYARHPSADFLQTRNRNRAEHQDQQTAAEAASLAPRQFFPRGWEKEEALRRELNVGAGPECGRRQK